MTARTGTALLLALLVAPAAWGQDVSRLEPVVVTATKLETPAGELGAAVTVITGEELETYHYPTVAEALRRVPGVEIRRSGSLGKTTSISIRGARPNQVQVLVDGVRVKSPTLGEVDLSDLSPDLIERIEVIRGAQSTVYGADAIGGVVNIITRRGRGPLSATLHQEAGTYDTLRSVATASGALDIFDYALSASHLESNGQFVNDGMWQNALNLRLGASLPRDTRLSLAFRYSDGETDLPVKFTGVTPLPIQPVIDENNENQSETTVLSLSARSRPLPWWETEVRFGRYTNDSRFIDLPDPGFPCDFPPCEFPSFIQVERREAEWLNHLHVARWSTSTVGLEYRDEEGEAEGAFEFAAKSHTRSVFFQQAFRFFDRLFVSGGVRVEDNSVFGTETTGSGSVAYVVKATGTRLRGSAGSGFRAPTINNLFFPGFSDPTLEPERSLSWDAGVDQRLWNGRIRLGLTYFYTRFTDLIAFRFIPTAPFVEGVNIGRARAEGIELASEVDLTDTLTASLGYTYTESEDLTIDRPLPREPRHRWNIGLTWQPTRRLSLFTQVHVVTRQFESAATAADPRAGVYNTGHTRVDVGGTYRLVNRYGFLQGLDVTARIDNLLDEEYAEVRGFPALGLHALVGLRASF